MGGPPYRRWAKPDGAPPAGLPGAGAGRGRLARRLDWSGLRQFFLGIPRELFEAARVDGASHLRMFWSVAMPLTRAALIVVFIFELKASWTDLLKPLIYIRDVDLFTLPRGLQLLVAQFDITSGGEGEMQLVMAAAVIITLPMIIVFFLGQRYFVEGIATTGRKG